MKRILAARILLLGALVLLLAACAGRTADRQAESLNVATPDADPGQPPPPEADELDNYADVPAAQTISDPLEGWNRFWFGANDMIYSWLFQPLFKGYAFVTPQGLRSGLRNIMVNALFPLRFVNSLLQGKVQAAGVELGRFLVNTTVGMGGSINVAKDLKTVVPVDPDGEDFGQTLGVWGVGPGIYLVWPILGPNNVRDTAGRAVDMLTDPVFWLPGLSPTVTAVNSGIWIGLRFNAASDTMENYGKISQIAVDPYIAMRDMFTKYRQSKVER
jgi:phospholipid-binding lipoprotein MlaA